MVTDQELNAHFEKIRPEMKGDGAALKGFLLTWCPAYMQDVQETAEGLMLEFSMDVSDRYMYTLISCVRSACVEKESEFPQLSDSEYAEISLNLLKVQSEESEFTLEYFEQLLREFEERFPITVRFIEQLGYHLVDKHRITLDEFDYGFYPGREHAMSVIAEAMRR